MGGGDQDRGHQGRVRSYGLRRDLHPDLRCTQSTSASPVAYLDEKREALRLWARRLRSIVSPPPPNVVPLHAEQGA
jgi:hypothetical protein